MLQTGALKCIHFHYSTWQIDTAVNFYKRTYKSRDTMKACKNAKYLWIAIRSSNDIFRALNGKSKVLAMKQRIFRLYFPTSITSYLVEKTLPHFTETEAENLQLMQSSQEGEEGGQASAGETLMDRTCRRTNTQTFPPLFPNPLRSL